MKIDHINIAAASPQLEAVRDFYCQLLALQEGPRPDFGIPGYWLYAGEDAIVHLVASDNHARPQAPPHLDHVAFACEDLPLFKARLDNLGIEYSALEMSATQTQLFCQDPCGNGVELNFKHG